MLQSIFVFTTIAVVIIGFPIFLVYLMCVWNFDQTSHENLQKNVINHAKRFGAYIKTLSTSRPVKVVASILSVLLVSLSIYADFAGVGLAPQVEPGQVSTCKSDETVCIVVVDFFEVNRTATTKAGMQIAEEIYSGLTDLDPKQSQFVVVRNDKEFRSIDSTERALAAEELAKAFHADIVIYGVVKFSDKAWEIAPEFLVNIKNNYEIQEVVGQYQLGTPFLIGDPNDLTGRIERIGILHARVEALSYITLGLAKYASILNSE